MTTKPIRWYVKELPDGTFYAENGERSHYTKRGTHCIRCAYAEVLSEYGGDCSLKGLNNGSHCYHFLSMLVRSARRGEEVEDDS